MTTADIASDMREVLFTVSDCEPLTSHQGAPFQPEKLSVTFRNGQLSWVFASGPAIRKDGSLGASERWRGFTTLHPGLIEFDPDTPAWVDDAVRVARGVRP